MKDSPALSPEHSAFLQRQREARKYSLYSEKDDEHWTPPIVPWSETLLLLACLAAVGVVVLKTIWTK